MKRGPSPEWARFEELMKRQLARTDAVPDFITCQLCELAPGHRQSVKRGAARYTLIVCPFCIGALRSGEAAARADVERVLAVKGDLP